MRDIKDKVCIVTGSTSGIGKETAKKIAQLGARTVIVSRNKQRGENAQEEISRFANNDNVDLYFCDFSSQKDIKSFTAGFKRKYKRLDILVNNAGLMCHERKQTDAGIEMTFAVNHLGYFLTTHYLLETLKETPFSRIVVVASHAHYNSNFDIENLMHTHDYNGYGVYSDSKLANLLFTYHLANHIKNLPVTINALHPGIVKTKFSIRDRNSNNTFPMGVITPEQGAETPLYLALSDEVEGVTGLYFDNKKAVKSSPLSYNKELGEKLWLKSMKLTGLT